MSKKIKKYLAVLLAFFMLLSSTGVYGFTHTCHCTGTVENYIFYSSHSGCCKQDLKVKKCCAAKTQKQDAEPVGQCKLEGKKCCDTTLKYFQMDSDLVSSEYEISLAFSFEYLKQEVKNNFYNFPNLPIETDIYLRLSYQSSLFSALIPAMSGSECLQLLQSMRC